MQLGAYALQGWKVGLLQELRQGCKLLDNNSFLASTFDLSITHSFKSQIQDMICENGRLEHACIQNEYNRRVSLSIQVGSPAIAN